MPEFTSDRYPVMPLRDIVLFPGMVAPLVVGRKNSIHALEHAMREGSLIFLVTQKDANKDEPHPEDLYTCGVLASVMQLLRLPDGTIKALVEGKKRAVVATYIEGADFLQADVREQEDKETNRAELPAYTRELRRVFSQYAKIKNKKIPVEILKSVAALENPAKLVDLICAHIRLQSNEKQEILETVVLSDRLRKVLETIYREIELYELEKSIEFKVKKKMTESQRNYYLGEKVKEIQGELGQGGDDLSELEEALKKKELPESVREKAVRELNKLRAMPPMSAETTVVRNYLDILISLPWQEKDAADLDIEKAENILDQDHYGLKKPKERILEYLAVQTQVEKIRGTIL
ncbi:MAG: endopeptidase La, partial [Candidatus Electrothrix sp. AR3]|nr:endopeptidase La [Candidatus Electrothrix sp. AR3]